MYEIFCEWQDMESAIFLVSLVAKKSIVRLTLSEKETSEASWAVAFFNSCRLSAEGLFVRQCRMD